jgi:hypothetical protein
VVSGWSNDGTTFRNLFEPSSSEFTSIDLGDLPEGAGAQYVNAESVVLNDVGDDGSDGEFSSGGSVSVAEANDYRFELSVQFADESATIS